MCAAAASSVAPQLDAPITLLATIGARHNASENRVRVRFGNCQFDTDERRLQTDGQEKHLSPKAFDVLALLIESRPRALAKGDILEKVWPGTFVTEASLARVITEIRAALGDRARDGGGIVRTVHTHGYAFVAEIDPAAPAARADADSVCWLFCANHDFALPDGEHIIGRDADAAVRLDSPRVSRRHARIVVRGEAATLYDLDSKNGVFVGDERVVDARALRSGEEIRIGPMRLLFRVVGPQMSTETAAAPFTTD